MEPLLVGSTSKPTFASDIARTFNLRRCTPGERLGFPDLRGSKKLVPTLFFL